MSADKRNALLTIDSDSDDSDEEVDEKPTVRAQGLEDFAREQRLFVPNNHVPLHDQLRKLNVQQAFHGRVERLEHYKQDKQAQWLTDNEDFVVGALTEIEKELASVINLPSFLAAFRACAVQQMRVPENVRLIGIGRDLYVMAGSMFSLFRTDEDLRPPKIGSLLFQTHNYHQEAETFLLNESILATNRRQAEKRKLADDEDAKRKETEAEEKRREDEEFDKACEEATNKLLDLQFFDTGRYHHLLFNGYTEADADRKCKEEAIEARIESQQEREIVSSPPRSEVDPADFAFNPDNVKLEDDLAIHTPIYHPEAHLDPADVATALERAGGAGFLADSDDDMDLEEEEEDVNYDERRGGGATSDDEGIDGVEMADEEEEEEQAGVDGAAPEPTAAVVVKQEQPWDGGEEAEERGGDGADADDRWAARFMQREDFATAAARAMQLQREREEREQQLQAEQEQREQQEQATAAAAARAAQLLAEQEERARNLAHDARAEQAQLAHEEARQATLHKQREQQALHQQRLQQQQQAQQQQAHAAAQQQHQQQPWVQRQPNSQYSWRQPDSAHAATHERAEAAKRAAADAAAASEAAEQEEARRSWEEDRRREELGRRQEVDARVTEEAARAEKMRMELDKMRRETEQRKKQKVGEEERRKEAAAVARGPQKQVRVIPLEALHSQPLPPRQQQRAAGQQRGKKQPLLPKPQAHQQQARQQPHNRNQQQQLARQGFRRPPLLPPPIVVHSTPHGAAGSDEWDDIAALVQRPPPAYGRPPAPMDYGLDEEVMEMTHDGRVQPVKTKLLCIDFEKPEVFPKDKLSTYEKPLNSNEMAALIGARASWEAEKRNERMALARTGVKVIKFFSSGQDRRGNGYAKPGDVKLVDFPGAAVREQFTDIWPKVDMGVRPSPRPKLLLKHKRKDVPVLLTDLHAHQLFTTNAYEAGLRQRLVDLQLSYHKHPRKKVTFRDADDPLHQIHVYQMQAEQMPKMCTYDVTDDGVDVFHMTKPMSFLTQLNNAAAKFDGRPYQLRQSTPLPPQKAISLDNRYNAGDCHSGTASKSKMGNAVYKFHEAGATLPVTKRADVIFTRDSAKIKKTDERKPEFREYAVSHRDYKIILAMKSLTPDMEKKRLKDLRLCLTNVFGYELHPALAKSPGNAGCSHLVLTDSLLDRVNTFRFPQTHFVIHHRPQNISMTFRVLCNEIPIEKLMNIEWFIFAYGFDEIVFGGEHPRVVAERVMQHALGMHKLYCAGYAQLRSSHRLTITPKFRVFKLPTEGMDDVNIKPWMLEFNNQLDSIAAEQRARIRPEDSTFLALMVQVVEWETPEIVKETIAKGVERVRRARLNKQKGATDYRYNCIDGFVESATVHCEMRVGRASQNVQAKEQLRDLPNKKSFQWKRLQARVHGLSEEEHNRYY